MNKVRVFVTGDTHNMLDWKKLNTSNFPEQKKMTKNDIVIIASDAEKLFGPGQLIFSPSFPPKPVTLQGAYVSYSEEDRVVAYFKEKYIKLFDY